MKTPLQSAGRALFAALVFLCAMSASPRAAEEGSPEAYMDPSPENARKRVALATIGLDIPVIGSPGIQPVLGAYLDLPRSLQVGLKIRSDIGTAREAYDYYPQVALHLRQVWLSDQDTSTVGNTEYFTLALGGYAAYDFQGARAGIKPFAAIVVGKYWMPFRNQPFGLDFCLELTRYFDGHPPYKERNHFFSAGINLFRVL